MNRREALATAGLLLAVPGAGCLGTGTETGSDPEPVEDWSYDVADAAPSLAFDEVGPDDHSLAVHVTSAETAGEAFEYDALAEDPRREVQAFVDETDFETDTLFYVETRAPNACHGLVVQSLDVSEERSLTGAVESQDTSAGDADCAAVETTPALLLRVRAEPGTVSHAELTVTDGWGETAQVSSSAA